MAGLRLMDGNPNIADLSDLNRPTRLGERFQQMYDDEWTNAFSDLTDHGALDDVKACNTLYKIVTSIYRMCSNKAVEQMTNLVAALKTFTNCDQLEDNVMLSIKTFKEGRKKNYQAVVPDLQQDGIAVMLGKLPCDVEQKENLTVYANACTEICWLMCIQDPPVVMLTSCKSKDVFNRDLYRYFTKSGDFVDFGIWPAVLLHENGPVLQKGVAQGRPRTKRKKKSPRKSISENSNVSPKVTRKQMTDPAACEDDDDNGARLDRKREHSGRSASIDKHVGPLQDMTTDCEKETPLESLSVPDKRSIQQSEDNDITEDLNKGTTSDNSSIPHQSSSPNIERMKDINVPKYRDACTEAQSDAVKSENSLSDVEGLGENVVTEDHDTEASSGSALVPAKIRSARVQGLERKTEDSGSDASVSCRAKPIPSSVNEQDERDTDKRVGSASVQIKTSSPNAEVLEGNYETNDREGANSVSSVLLIEKCSSPKTSYH